MQITFLRAISMKYQTLYIPPAYEVSSICLVNIYFKVLH